MDLKVAGVDIRSRKRSFIAGKFISWLEGIEGATNKDIAGEMIKAIEKISNKKKQDLK
jgi:ribosomal protein S6--L-glutamate ligase